MSFEVRKIVTYRETTFIEGGKRGERPVTMVGVAAVITNPWSGRGFVEDLSPEIRQSCSSLGEQIVELMVQVEQIGELMVQVITLHRLT